MITSIFFFQQILPSGKCGVTPRCSYCDSFLTEENWNQVYIILIHQLNLTLTSYEYLKEKNANQLNSMKLKRLLIYAMAKNNSRFIAIYLLLFGTEDFYENNLEKKYYYSTIFRSSQWKVFLGVSQNSQENTRVRVSFLINLQSWACNFIKKKLWHRCFPVNFAKFLNLHELRYQLCLTRRKFE